MRRTLGSISSSYDSIVIVGSHSYPADNAYSAMYGWRMHFCLGNTRDKEYSKFRLHSGSRHDPAHIGRGRGMVQLGIYKDGVMRPPTKLMNHLCRNNCVVYVLFNPYR